MLSALYFLINEIVSFGSIVVKAWVFRLTGVTGHKNKNNMNKNQEKNYTKNQTNIHIRRLITDDC